MIARIVEVGFLFGMTFFLFVIGAMLWRLLREFRRKW